MCDLPRRTRGFTVIEIAIVLAISGILATAAWPSWRDQLLRSHRIEATMALQRLQAAQARHYESFGWYADGLDRLAGAPALTTDGGHYRLTLRSDRAENYVAVATALGGQAEDRGCAQIELQVRGAISVQLPDGRCWAR